MRIRCYISAMKQLILDYLAGMVIVILALLPSIFL